MTRYTYRQHHLNGEPVEGEWDLLEDGTPMARCHAQVHAAKLSAMLNLLSPAQRLEAGQSLYRSAAE